MTHELRLLLAFTTHLPPVKGMGAIANILRAYYTRTKREVSVVSVLGNRMELDPHECVDSELLFYPQLYDRAEIAYLRQTLKPGNTFVDIGSNIGIYALVAAQCVEKKGQVIAIEADPYNYKKLIKNKELSGAKNITALNIGAADTQQTLELSLNETGNRGGNSFLRSSDPNAKKIKVKCLPLADILTKEGVTTIHGAKLDIEGLEFRVLKAFFASAPQSIWPQFIIIEHTPTQVDLAGGDAITLLKNQGYTVHKKTSMNYILTLSAA